MKMKEHIAGEIADGTLIATNFRFEEQTGFYRGKVRDVYFIGDRWVVMVVTDRVSAFDVVLPRGIPHKGAVLNSIAAFFLRQAKEAIPVWLVEVPHPNVSVGYRCEPVPVEMIIRAYLAGSAWRKYKSGVREWCGQHLPDNLRENDPLPHPIITPTTKAHEGHDMDICREEIIAQGLATPEVYEKMEHYTRQLFEMGASWARRRGLILVDTKYEFGLRDGEVMVIDEVHTPDSSRYFYLEGYEERQREGKPQKQLSKEFIRQWLMEQGFMGREGESVPAIPDWVVEETSRRYLEVCELLTGERPPVRVFDSGELEAMYEAVRECLRQLES